MYVFYDCNRNETYGLSNKKTAIEFMKMLEFY